MSSVNRISALVLCFAITSLTGGCVGPMACGPKACGPLALGHPCDGCDQCDGCGELYIDPWINEPADCCDPCDTCGNYNGQSCGKCRSVFAGARTLWGYRYGGCDGCHKTECDCQPTNHCGSACGGCDACGQQDATCGSEPYVVGNVPLVLDAPVTGHHSDNDRVIRVVEQPRQSLPSPPESRSYPQDIPRIFQPRPTIAAEPSPAPF